MKLLRIAGALALTIGATVGVSAQDRELPPAKIVNFEAGDPVMNAAKERGRASLPHFYARLANPAADEGQFMVKFDIRPGQPAEYVWATQLDRSTSPMTGILLSQPVHTRDRSGDRVPIAEADIIDWMYRKGRVFQGGVTERVVLDRMDPAQASLRREALGW